MDVLQAAHRQGLSHGNPTAETVALRDGHIQLLHWERGLGRGLGDGSSPHRYGPSPRPHCLPGGNRRPWCPRAAAFLDQIRRSRPSCKRRLSPRAASPADFHERKELESLRDALATSVPETGEVELEQMRRFSMKTTTVIVGIIAVYLLFVSINFEQLQQALSRRVRSGSLQPSRSAC